MRSRSAALAVIAMLSVERPAHAGCEPAFATFGTRMARLAEPTNLALFGAAALSPFALAPTGGDWALRSFYLRDLGGSYDQEAVSRTAPFALAGALALGWGLAALEHDCGASTVASRAFQSVAVATGMTAVLKIVVGRTYPAVDPAHSFDDEGRAWRAAPFQTFGAWPSGHAASTFAFAAALRSSMPRRLGMLGYIGYPLAAGVSAGMLLGDHHWTSDVVSGALLGEAVGRSVGGEARRSVSIVPTATGFAVTGTLD